MTLRAFSALLLSALTVALWIALAAGCVGRSSVPARPESVDVFDLYPLHEGNAWSYDVDTGEPSTTLAVTRVESFDGRFAEVRTASSTIRYEVRPEGIYLPSEDAWVIRSPLRAGEQWSGRGGRAARVTSTAVTLDTPAGNFRGCVEVREEGGKLELEVRTVYCPRVGPVSVTSTMRSNVSDRVLVVSALLRGFSVSPTPVPDR